MSLLGKIMDTMRLNDREDDDYFLDDEYDDDKTVKRGIFSKRAVSYTHLDVYKRQV